MRMNHQSEYELALVPEPINNACENCELFLPNGCGLGGSINYECEVGRPFILIHKLTGQQVIPEDIVKLYRSNENEST